MPFYKSQKSFTLVELLIVIAILALLMSIIIISINPAEMLRKTRDTKRISELNGLNNALGIFQASKPNTSLGTANKIYVSLPAANSDCSDLSLPTPPTNYTYVCSNATNYRKTDGNGWIPVNFNSLDTGSPISVLATDPTNAASTGLYYTYSTSGTSFELDATFESQTMRLSGDTDKTSTDGGDNYSLFEIGTDLTLNPLKDSGLVGYWKFDEGSGTTGSDSSRYGNNGTLVSNPAWVNGIAGKCLNFGSCTYVNVPDATILDFGTSNFSISVWAYLDTTSDSFGRIVGKKDIAAAAAGYSIYWRPGISELMWSTADGSLSSEIYTADTITIGWHHIVMVRDSGDANNGYFYIDGVKKQLASAASILNVSSSQPLTIGSIPGCSLNFVNKIDDVRVYNRALSEAEIRAIYNATK